MDTIAAVAGALEQRAAELTDCVKRAANMSGGWPYYAGKGSRIEPTCWALLALRGAWSGTDADWSAFAVPHLMFIQGCQRSDGLLTDTVQSSPNLMAEGLAACILADLFPELRATFLPRLLRGIVAIKGIKVNDTDARQNNTLQAWPWYPDTFSWLEPTAWCVLALKKFRALDTPGAADRLAEAERMMENRSCQTGGWNFGNASALGQDLRPHVPPTATALLALHDRRYQPVVMRGLAFLDQARVKEISGMALGLTALCLRIYDRDATEVEARLVLAAENTQALGNVYPMAVALHALTAAQHQARTLRVPA